MISVMSLFDASLKNWNILIALVNNCVALSSFVTVIGVKYGITFLTSFGVFVFTATYMH